MDFLYQNNKGDFLSDEYQPLLKGGGEIKEYCSTRYFNVKPMYLATQKDLPELYFRKELCCGCSACFFVCPKSKEESKEKIRYKFLKTSAKEEEYNYTGAISMLPDEEGFIYPVVDAEKCIRCYKCLKVCPYKG